MKAQISLSEAITNRKSVRLYDTNRPVENEIGDGIAKIIAEFEPTISGGKVGLDILSHADLKDVYGRSDKVEAPYYLAFSAEDIDHSLVDVGRLAQTIGLFLTSYGLGSCYLGMLSPKSKKALDLPYAITVAFGYQEADKPFRKVEKADRKSFGAIVVNPEHRIESTDGNLMRIVQAGRLAPSAMNRQPWRFAPEEGLVHIWRRKQAALIKTMFRLDRLNEIDCGIALGNMETQARELGYKTHVLRVDESGTPVQDCLYEGTLFFR